MSRIMISGTWPPMEDVIIKCGIHVYLVWGIRSRGHQLTYARKIVEAPPLLTSDSSSAPLYGEFDDYDACRHNIVYCIIRGMCMY